MADGVRIVEGAEEQSWPEAVAAYWDTMAEVVSTWCAETAQWREDGLETKVPEVGTLRLVIGQFQSLALSAAMTTQALKDELARLEAEGG